MTYHRVHFGNENSRSKIESLALDGLCPKIRLIVLAGLLVFFALPVIVPASIVGPNQTTVTKSTIHAGVFTDDGSLNSVIDFKKGNGGTRTIDGNVTIVLSNTANSSVSGSVAAIVSDDSSGQFEFHLDTISITRHAGAQAGSLYGFLYLTDHENFTGSIGGTRARNLSVINHKGAAAYGVAFNIGNLVSIGSGNNNARKTIHFGNITARALDEEAGVGATGFVAKSLNGANVTLGDVAAQSVFTRDADISNGDPRNPWAFGIQFSEGVDNGTLTIGGVNVLASGDRGKAIGILLENNGVAKNGLITALNITASGHGFARGVEMGGDLEGKLTTGAITVNQTGTGLGSNGLEGYLPLAGSLSPGGEFGLNAVGVLIGKEGNIAGELLTGNVIAAAEEGNAAGIFVSGGVVNGGKITTGTLAASGKGVARGVEMHGDLAGTVTTGNITAAAEEGNAAGIFAGNGVANGGVLTAGTLTASGEDFARGVEMHGDLAGTVTTGNITAAAEEGNAAGVFVGGDVVNGGTLTTGSITAGGVVAQGIQVIHGVAGNISVGSVRAAGTGAAFGLQIGDFFHGNVADLTGRLTLGGNIVVKSEGLDGGLPGTEGNAFGLMITANVVNEFEGGWNPNGDEGNGAYEGTFLGGGVINGTGRDIFVEGKTLAVGVGIGGSISTGDIKLGNITVTGMGGVDADGKPAAYADQAVGFIAIEGITVARQKDEQGNFTDEIVLGTGNRTNIDLGNIVVASVQGAIGFGVGDVLLGGPGAGIDNSTIRIKSIETLVQEGVALGWWSGAVTHSLITITNGIEVVSEKGGASGIYVDGDFNGTLNTGTMTVTALNAGDDTVTGITIDGGFDHKGGTIGRIIVDAVTDTGANAYGIAVTGSAHVVLWNDIMVFNGAGDGVQDAGLAIGIQAVQGGTLTIANNIRITAADGGIVSGDDLTLHFIGSRVLELSSIHIHGGTGTLNLTGTGTLRFTGEASINTDNIHTIDLGENARLEFAQNTEGTYAGVFTGEGGVESKGTWTLSGDSSDFEGTFTQTSGLLHLTDTAHGTAHLGGYFVQNAGTLTSAEGAKLEEATFKGTVKPTGTLEIASATFLAGAIVDVGQLETEDNRIAVVNDLVFAGATTLSLNVLHADTDKSYTLMTFGGILEGLDYLTIAAEELGEEQRGGVYVDANALLFAMIDGNAALNWTGASSEWSTATTNSNWNVGSFDTSLKFNTYFKEGDTVIFGEDDSITNRTVTVGSGGVKVDSMEVTGTGYVFNVTAGELPAIESAGDIDFGDAALNIIGYIPDESGYELDGSNTGDSVRHILTVVQAGGDLIYNHPVITVAGQASVDFLSALAYQEDNTIKVETRLTWFLTDLDRPAHGTFTIAEGAEFTLGFVLKDNDKVDVDGSWDGKSLTKMGGGTLILTGANEYTGGTFVKQGTLVVTTESLPGDVEVNDAANTALVFEQEAEGTYAGVLSGEGLAVKTGEGLLTLSGDSSGFEGFFLQWKGDLHLTETAHLGGLFGQHAGTTFTSADGAALSDAEFRGTVMPSGTLYVASALFEDAMVDFGLLTDGNRIEADGEICFAGLTTIKIDAAGIDAPGTHGFTLMQFDHFCTYEGSDVSIDPKNLGNHRGGAYLESNALMYDVIVGNTTLYWTGASSVWSTAAAGMDWATDNIYTYFKEGDTVIFSEDERITNRTVNIGSGGVKVAAMTVEGTGYIFNLMPGAIPAIVSLEDGDIHLGDATLNITGLSAGGDWRTVIQTHGSGLLTTDAETIHVTVAGLTHANFLTVDVEQTNSEVRMRATLNWNPNESKEVDFGIQGGHEFTLGTHLVGGNSLLKTGDGTLILTGNNNYTGATTVTAGTLQVEGTIANSNVAVSGANTVFVVGSTSNSTAKVGGEVTVSSGGTLTGHGTLDGPVTIGSGGTLSPGSSIGKMLFTNGVTFRDGSTYLFEVDMDGSDCLDVSGGIITIEHGAKLQIVFDPDVNPIDEGPFQVINIAIGSAVFNNNGEHFTIVDTWGLKFTHGIDDDGYWVTAAMAEEFFPYTDLVSGVATPNALRVAAAMDKIAADIAEYPAHRPVMKELNDALLGMEKDDHQALADAFAQLHGEAYAATQVASVNLQRNFVRLLPSAGERLMTPQEAALSLRGQVPGALWNRWGTLTGSWSERDKLEQFSGYRLQTFGVAVGMDRRIMNNFLIGGAVAYDNVNQEFKSIYSEDQSNAFRALLYSGWRAGNTFIDGYAGYSKSWHETERSIDITNSTHPFSGIAKSKYSDDMMAAGIEAGHKLYFASSQLTPSVGLHYVHLSTPDITETGAGAAVLHMHSNKYDSLRLPVGVRWNTNFTWGYGIVWTPELRAYYVGELGDTTTRIQSSFGNARDVSFYSESGDWGQHSGRIGLGLNTQWRNRVNFRVDYEHEAYKHTSINRLGAALGVNW